MAGTETQRRVAVYIDGNNFYKYIKDKEVSFPRGVKFDFERFVNNLVGDRYLISKRYYVGIARNVDDSEKSREIVKGQQKFLSHLENEGFAIKRGRVMYDSGRIREKGTDVKMAVDLVIGAADDLYDTVVVVSSDTDLIPAIQYIKYKGKRIEYVGFSHAPSLGMQKHADLSILLTPQDINKLRVSDPF